MEEKQLEIREEIVEVANKIGARTDRILSSIKKSGDEDLQLKILKKYLVHLEYFDRKNFVYTGAN